jgi:thiol:disulfide interchange protein
MSLKFIQPITSEKEFREQVAEQPPTTLCFLDVHAEWCGPCTGLGKRLTNISSDLMECAGTRLQAHA